MKLLQTVKQKNGHSHIVYVNDKKGEGVTSKTKDHIHQVVDDIEQVPQFNPQTGQPLIDPQTGQIVVVPKSNGWKVLPAHDGHTHLLAEYVSKKKEEKKDDVITVKENISLYKEAKEYEKESVKKATESEEFYRGEQWSKESKNELKSKKRAALTINEIESKIDLLSGYHRSNRTDIKYIPVEDGDAKIAEMLTIVAKNVLDQCNFESEENDVFDDMLIPGRGNYDIYVDYDSNIRGDIKIERFPWDNIYYGPHIKRDASDCEYIVKWKWYSKAKIEQLFPDVADKLTSEVETYNERDDLHHNPGEGYTDPDESWEYSPDVDLVNIQRKEFKMLEIWRKEYHREYVAVNVEDDFYFNAESWNESDVNAIKTIPGFTVISRVAQKIRVVKTASKTLLDDDYPELVWDDFYTIPVYAKKRGKEWWGKVEAAKDAQRENNKRHSQLIDIANKVATYGWFYDGSTFSKPSDMQNFKNNSSSPGFIAEIQDVKRPPVQTEGVTFPKELAAIMAIESQKIKDVMNVNIAMSGQSSGDQSGAALELQKQQGLLGNEFLFDNQTLSKRKLARLLLLMIQKVYTPDRIYRVLQNQTQKNQVQIQGQPLEQYPREMILEMLENADLSKYDIAISENRWTPSNRIAKRIELKELAQQGFPIPPALMFKYIDIDDDDKQMALQSIQSQQQAEQQKEQGKVQGEIMKTKIAADSKVQAAQMKGTQR
jgi:hypothetical protein